ncbi:hypothetical protein H2248_012143 [Termitomyces sp. 'cryptogamus']|nr:hypothetical protein H2248_012143 [Termitomyces sp. 'cryptogamus']
MRKSVLTHISWDPMGLHFAAPDSAVPHTFDSYMYIEFHHIEKSGKGLNSIPIGNKIPSQRLKRHGGGDRDVFFPVLLGPNEYTDVNYTWVNPLGHWGIV